MLIEETLFGKKDKIQIAINRLKEFEPKHEPYILAFSGGKDSLAIYILAKMAGVKFKAVYALTTVDPPELVWHIKRNYPDVEIIYPKESMFALIERKLLPPTRITRWCCSEFKEKVGHKGASVILGVRAGESRKRSKHKLVSFFKGKIMVRPILDWSTEDVWAFIHANPQYKYCDLYEKMSRIGCIGCPLSSNAEKELDMYPKYREAYIRAFDRMIARRLKLGKSCDWKNGQEVMDWWLQKNKKDKNLVSGQCDIFSQFEGI
ncbi:MAG: phosphoadenosine phosphosulfate reductase family protein [Clostridium sp.]